MAAEDESRPCTCCGGSPAPASKAVETAHLLCFCFGHSLESLRAEWAATGRMDSVEAIRTAVKEGRCRCDQLNPSGACCLGEVLKAAMAIQEASVPRPGKG